MDIQVGRACKSYTRKYAGFVQGVVPAKRPKRLNAVYIFNFKFRISLAREKIERVKIITFSKKTGFSGK